MGLYQGDVRVAVGGRSLTFAFDYAAQDALRTLLGKDWQEMVGVAIGEQNVTVLAQVAAIGLRRHQPEVTAEALIEWSPPSAHLAGAIARGLKVAWWGAGEPPSEDPAGKNERATSASRMWTLFSRISRWHSGWASGPSSGASAPLN